MQFPITIGLHRSSFLDGLVLLTALLASVAVIAVPGETWLRGGLLALIWVFSLLAWRQLKPGFARFRLNSAGRIFIAETGEADFLPVEPEPGATVHPWLTVVRLRGEDGRRYRLIATVDSLKREDFRRLRIFLRWRADFNDVGDAA